MIITMPNGVRVVVLTGQFSYDYNLSNAGQITISIPGAISVKYAPTNAQYVLSQMDAAIAANSPNPVVIADPAFSASSWTSITPNAAIEVGSLQSYVIVGTFNQFPTALQFDDAHGHIVPLMIDNNNNQTTSSKITTIQASLPANGTYLLYWSPDNGTTWRPTTLSVVAATISLSFVSETPSTIVHGSGGLQFTITGTGFLNSGITDIEWDDGASHIGLFVATIISDTTIQYVGSSGIIATYNVNYSTDGGATFQATGLPAISAT